MLTDYIRANPSATDSEILAAVNALSVEHTDPTAYTWSGLTMALLQRGASVEVCAGLKAVLPSLPGGDLLDSFLLSGGANLTLPPLRQALVNASAGLDEQGQALIAAVLSVGVWQVSLWQSWGNSGECEQSDIAAARAEIARDAVSAWWAGVVNEIVHPLIASGGSRAEILAAIAGAE